MLRRHFRKFPLLVFILPLVLVLATSLAQDNTCDAIVQQALSSLGQNCDAMDRNSACYGFNKLGATFNEAQADDYFSKVSDRTPLNIVDTLTSTPLDTVNNTWGVAVMKVQANVPNSLPGQAVTFVLLGDAQIRNDVSPTDAFTPADGVDVSAIGNVNIRSAPSTRANVLGSVPDSTVLPADGRSADGEWLRVPFNESPAWINRSLVNAPDAADNLPVITADLRTPMQAFYVTTGIGSSVNCNQAPDVLMIQGPDTMKVNLTVNGADVQIGSTIVIRSLPFTLRDILNDEELMKQFRPELGGKNLPDDLVCNLSQLFVVDGQADVNEDTLTLPTGFTARSLDCGGADRSSSFRSFWGGLRPMTQDELDELKTLEKIPPELLDYPIHVPTQAEIQEIVRALGGGGGGTTTGEAGNPAECSTLRPTSPLGGMPGGNVTFYWDGIAGATSYTVRVYDGSGQVGEYSTNAPNTSVSGTPGGTGAMAWNVSAYIDGRLACTSARASVVRDQFFSTAIPPTASYVTTCVNTFVDPFACSSPCTLGATCGTIPGKEFLCTCPA